MQSIRDSGSTCGRLIADGASREAQGCLCVKNSQCCESLLTLVFHVALTGWVQRKDRGVIAQDSEKLQGSDTQALSPGLSNSPTAFKHAQTLDPVPLTSSKANGAVVEAHTGTTNVARPLHITSLPIQSKTVVMLTVPPPETDIEQARRLYNGCSSKDIDTAPAKIVAQLYDMYFEEIATSSSNTIKRSKKSLLTEIHKIVSGFE